MSAANSNRVRGRFSKLGLADAPLTVSHLAMLADLSRARGEVKKIP